MHDVIGVKYLHDFAVEVAFDNGKRAKLDLRSYASKSGVFKPLANVAFFKKVSVNKELGTICWPNGADIAPETVYRLAQEKVI